jgi:hypothetical protein
MFGLAVGLRQSNIQQPAAPLEMHGKFLYLEE